MNKEKGIIKYIVIIIIILAAVVLSQLSYFSKMGKDLFSGASDKYGASDSYWAKGANWVKDNIFSKISGEVQKRGDKVKEEFTGQKEKATETIGEKIKNYFNGIVDSVFHPGNDKTEAPTETQSQVCPPCQQIQSSPYQTSQP